MAENRIDSIDFDAHEYTCAYCEQGCDERCETCHGCANCCDSEMHCIYCRLPMLICGCPDCTCEDARRFNNQN